MAICLIAAVVAVCKDDPESSGAKSENSTLQAMMLRHDSEPIASVKLFTEMGYNFACVPTKERKIWVMLNARYTPHYKSVP
jgi:hypothetical protein